MDIWFLSDSARLARERDAVHKLQQKAKWLQGIEWTISTSAELEINAAIVAHGHTYNVRMTYPKHFPYAPPIVRPADSTDSWSSHQYGDGTLCLEWGPDTWVFTVTGAQVLESAYRLLFIENPFGYDTQQIAPSRHYLTQGQQLRGTLERVYLGESLSTHLKSLPELTSGAMIFSIHPQRDSYTLLIQELDPVSGTVWKGSDIPNALRRKKAGVWVCQGLFFIVGLPAAALTGICSLEDMENVLGSAGYNNISLTDLEALKGFGLEKQPEGILIAGRDRNPHIYSVYGENRLFRAQNLPVEESASWPRTPVELQLLAEKRVGIVGLGSLGSKVAISLARMGSRRFYLVDDDIVMPENLCRHGLDWLSVGAHKTAAVAQAIDRIVVEAEIEISKLNLTGQENPAALSGVLDKLSHCDIVLDMTAESHVFNLLTAVCKPNSTPFVWAEVFAGGFGGLVARSRPKKDPPPQIIRAAFLRYTEEKPFTEGVAQVPYSLENNAGQVVIASDADVSIIAAHAANLTVDTVLEREPSDYPYSLYLVGLRRSWVFEAPFHNIPIETAHFSNQLGEIDRPSASVLESNIDFVKGLLEKTCGKDSSSDQDR